MREILFRGKRADSGEWVYGDLLHPDIYGNGYSIEDFTKEKNNCFDIIPESISEFTGLTDKNGKKIFEGDILHFKTYQGDDFACPVGTDVYYRVLFGRCNPDMDTLTEYVGFWALGKNYDEDDLYECGNSISYLVDSHGACVIGNIHDNPELLGGEDNENTKVY